VWRDTKVSLHIRDPTKFFKGMRNTPINLEYPTRIGNHREWLPSTATASGVTNTDFETVEELTKL
jgi:hypothetical protein